MLKDRGCVSVKTRDVTADLPIDDCTDDDILATDIYDASGRKLITAHTALNDYLRSHLSLNGIRRVQVFRTAEKPCDISAAERKFNGVYREAVTRIREIFIGLSAGKKPDGHTVRRISNAILRQKDDSRIVCTRRLMSRLKAADQYTYSHSVNVAFYCMFIAKWLGLPECGIERSLMSGLLHDLGKTQIPNTILNKPGRLTKQEYERMKTHAERGYRLIEAIPEIEPCVKEAVLLHHERLDGSGYPFGIVPTNLFARIVAVADVYDAITSNRCYKDGASPFVAFSFFDRDGKTLFDWHIVSLFCANIAAALTGAEVNLTSGETGRIVYIPPADLTTPIVRLGSCYRAVPVTERRHGIVRILG